MVPNDILTINIKTIDPQLTEMFKVSEGNRAIMNEQILFFEGFNVDDHGQIRIPILGEVEVIGLTTEEVRIKIEKRLLEEYFNGYNRDSLNDTRSVGKSFSSALI